METRGAGRDHGGQSVCAVRLSYASHPAMKPDYDKVGLLTIRDGRFLLCRKKHTTALLILPGGCFEPGESAAHCLDRELREELGDVRVTDVEFVGVYTDVAAGSGPPK